MIEGFVQASRGVYDESEVDRPFIVAESIRFQEIMMLCTLLACLGADGFAFCVPVVEQRQWGTCKTGTANSTHAFPNSISLLFYHPIVDPECLLRLSPIHVVQGS